MAAKTITEMTADEIEELRLNVENQLIAIKRDKRKAKLTAAWQITKAVLFPIFVIVAVVAFICGGAILGILGESLKRIYK